MEVYGLFYKRNKALLRLKRKWKKFLEERGYTSGINLIAFARKNPFCDDYGIMGVPKYFIIGKDGKFLSRDVPGPGDGFEEMVDEVLSK